MARYTCGVCGRRGYGLGDFQEHIESQHDYENLSEAVRDCESIDEIGVFELDGTKAVKCAECRAIYDAIGGQCPLCGCEDIERPSRRNL